MAIQRKK
ncbi:flagellar assembly FliH family protein, partial [Vibrio parahaemolyticus 970107]